MQHQLNSEDLRRRIATITMDEAHMGLGGEPDHLVVENFGDSRFTFDYGSDGGDLDDALRLAVAVWPFENQTSLSYCWAGPANDEGYDRIVFQTHAVATESNYSQGRFLEVTLGQISRFQGGDVIDAVEFLVSVAAEALLPHDPGRAG